MAKFEVVSKEYSIAATEILDLLNYLPADIVEKIPTKLINFFKEVSIKDYKPEFDYSRRIRKYKINE